MKWLALFTRCGKLINAVIHPTTNLRLADGPGAGVLLADIELWVVHLTTVEDLSDTTVKKYRRDAGNLVAELKLRSWADLTEAAVAGWLAAHKQDQASPKRRKNLLSCARALCRWLVSSGRVPHDPTKNLRIRDRGKGGRGMRPFTVDEARRLLAWTARHDRDANKRNTRRLPFYTFLLFTGLRHSEARRVRWRDIDGVNRELRVLGKDRAETRITLADSVLNLLETLPKADSGARVFPQAVSLNTLRADIAAAGIDPRRVGFHSFRKTLATSLHTRVGLSLKEISQQTRHASIAVLERSYIEPEAAPMAAALAELERIVKKVLDTDGGTPDSSCAVIRTTLQPEPPTHGPSRRGLVADSMRITASDETFGSDRGNGPDGKAERGGFEPPIGILVPITV